MEYFKHNDGLDEAQAGLKIGRRNINNLRYADDTTLMGESKELKSLLLRVKEESEKACLKLNIQKAKILVFGPIISWKIYGETLNSERLCFWASKSLQVLIAAMKFKDTCSLEEKLCQLRQHIKKQRYYFASKVPSNQSYGFFSSHVWM